MERTLVWGVVALCCILSIQTASSMPSPGSSIGILPRVFLGDGDTRVKIESFKSGPTRRVVKLMTYFDENPLIAVSCTGTLVWKNLVLTNAHCVSDAVEPYTLANGNKAYRIHPSHHLRIKAEYARGGAAFEGTPHEIILGDYIPSSDGPHVKGDGTTDWAVVALKEDLGEVLGWMGYAEEFNPSIFHPSVYIAGYPSDFFDGEVMAHSKCSIRATTNGMKVLLHDCDTQSGSSGSPLYQCKDENTCYILGINFGVKSGGLASSATTYDDSLANLAVNSKMYSRAIAEYRKKYPKGFVQD